ncbi:MAG TPA: TadA family conjugal transfer-associated ATPase [Flexivirga sp.]|uniref:TadA family conjugal transfer-associated ATPase n=1 Tax=Flexivirga sp. TaxID=1962927 RepID=UPI002B693D7C|nr:TadA family conjugal transfer-associated ATPase [Flexivirga sp.]HWC24830.1 TadA family conjugal transfer-associated ATPase [Flexivirga sp.]
MSTPRGDAAVGEAMWAQIRDGRSPTSESVEQLAELDAAVLGQRSVQTLAGRLRADVFGAGPLEPLLTVPGVTDVLVNGVTGVWIDRGLGLERAPVELGDAAAVRRLAARLATHAGRRLDETSPYVDGLLPGGVRLHALLPPLVEGAAHISLRVPRREPPALSQLAESGTCCPEGLAVLRRIVEARVAFVISGGTGSGKTTLLASMLAEVEAAERIVVVEDVRELQIDHPHVVRLESRAPNVEGQGEITLSTLVRQSLRMRPDRLVVGEVRGAEVRELLSALNTGHEGGCGTVHANTSSDVLSRFEALGALAAMSGGAVRSQLASAVKIVIHVRRDAVARVVAEIGVISRNGDRLQVVPAMRRQGDRLCPVEGWSQLVALLDRDGSDRAAASRAAGGSS